jgi:hypothetical protein
VVKVSGFRYQGSGFRVQGSGFRVQGSGFRVLQTGTERLELHVELFDVFGLVDVVCRPQQRRLISYRNIYN